MKNLLLIIFSSLLISCGENQEDLNINEGEKEANKVLLKEAPVKQIRFEFGFCLNDTVKMKTMVDELNDHRDYQVDTTALLAENLWGIRCTSTKVYEADSILLCTWNSRLNDFANKHNEDLCDFGILFE